MPVIHPLGNLLSLQCYLIQCAVQGCCTLAGWGLSCYRVRPLLDPGCSLQNFKTSVLNRIPTTKSSFSLVCLTAFFLVEKMIKEPFTLYGPKDVEVGLQAQRFIFRVHS